MADSQVESAKLEPSSPATSLAVAAAEAAAIATDAAAGRGGPEPPPEPRLPALRALALSATCGATEHVLAYSCSGAGGLCRGLQLQARAHLHLPELVLDVPAEVRGHKLASLG